jgi:preprotein translocase subunit SecD
MATGLSLSATLGIMAVLAANQPQWSSTTVAAGSGTTPGAPSTTVVTDVVPRTIVLQPGETPPVPGTPVTDQATGAPVDPEALAPDPGTVLAADPGVPAGAPAPAPGPGVPAPAPAPQPVVTQPPVTAPPVTAPPPPTCSGSTCP